MTNDPVSEVVADEVAEVIETPTEPIETSAENIPSDADVNAALQEEFNRRLAAAGQQQRQISFQTFFEEGVALVATATGKRFRNNIPTVSEQTAVKIMELTMMWLLNHRGQPTPEFINSGSEGGETEEDSLDPFIPNEIIGGNAEENPE